MSYGLQTFGPNGELYFDGSRRALRVVHHQQVAASFTGNINIPGIAPQTHAAVCIPRDNMPYNRNLLAQVGNNFVSLTRYNNSYAPTTVLDLTVFGYA